MNVSTVADALAMIDRWCVCKTANVHPERRLVDNAPLRLVVPLRNRVKGSAIIVAMVLAWVAVAFLVGSRVLWVVAALCLPVMVVQFVELFRGATMEIGTDGVRTTDAFGRRKYFEFSQCSAFDVWTTQGGRHRSQMVVFNYTGTESTGLLTKQNKAYSGYNASLNAAFGLSATAMADVLNRHRLGTQTTGRSNVEP